MFFAVLPSLVLDGFDQLIKLFMHCPCCQLTHQHQEKSSWKCRDSNPGRWGAELECYCCSMETPLDVVVFASMETQRCVLGGKQQKIAVISLVPLFLIFACRRGGGVFVLSSPHGPCTKPNGSTNEASSIYAS